MSTDKLDKFQTIGTKIKELVSKDANQKALDIVIETNVQKEVDARANLIMKGLNAWEENERNLKKCRPDVITYPVNTDGDGEAKEGDVKNESYSEEQKKERDKLLKRKADLDVALMNAMNPEKQDFTKLQSLVGGGKDK